MIRIASAAALLLATACAGTPAPPRRAPDLRLAWEKNLLAVRGDFPGGTLETLYLEAYCRSGSTDRDWKDTVLPHRTELLSASPDGRELRLRCRVEGGVEVDHVVRAFPGEVRFDVEAVNRGSAPVDAAWVQPCVRVGVFTGLGKTDYVKRSFIFVGGQQVFLDRTRHEEKARYVPGQVFVPPGISRADVNPRPYSPEVPSNGLIGAVSADGEWLFATAWTPTQELFQGVVTCLHNDFRLGGLKPGERRTARGRFYLMENDPAALLARYRADFPEPFGAGPAGGEIRLLVRADDMGAARSMNEGCLRSVTEGIARSVEVIVPGPWFPDAVALLKDRPDIDVGIHLCLTSEWERVKWGPLTRAPGLSDRDGYFFPMVRQRKDFPPGTGLLDANPPPVEVEQELRAQIQAAKRHLPRLSHASAHMGAAAATPEFRAITERLCAEAGIRFEARGLKPVRGFGGAQKSAAQKESDLVSILEKLGPGDWILVEHPAVDGEESRALGHVGYTDVGADRAGVLHALTSPKVKEVVARRGIRLISYRDLP
jgi:hypothetical protein